jgi:hypothetical protein
MNDDEIRILARRIEVARMYAEEVLYMRLGELATKSESIADLTTALRMVNEHEHARDALSKAPGA